MKLLVKLLICAWSCQNAHSTDYGYQSGGFRTTITSSDHDVSNSYASSLHYDSISNAVYVVGSTYWSYWDRIIHSEEQIKNLSELDESDCFLAILSVPRDGDDTMHLDYSRRFGKSGIDEACDAISVVHDQINGKTRVVSSGHTVQGGFLTSLRNFGAPPSTVYGFMLDLELSGSAVGKLRGGSLMYDHQVQYPVAVAYNPNPIDFNDEAFYVVSLTSLSGSENPLNENKDPRPNKAIGGVNQPEYGSHYSAFIKKMVPKTQAELDYEDANAELVGLTNDEGGLKQTIRSNWTELLSPEISFDDVSIEHYLRIADLKYVPHIKVDTNNDRLVLVGTTTGFGKAFGGSIEVLNDDDITDESYNDKAGFIAVFDLEGGLEVTTRLEVEGEDVDIKGICTEQGADSVDYIYIVGETTGLLADDMQNQDLSKNPYGDNSIHAFVTKLKLVDLSREWTRQLGGGSGKDLIAEGCAVSPGGDVVYMAGTVVDGGNIRLPKSDSTSSAGGDDIFVANYKTNSGARNYVKQIGSSRDDWLAKGNGIACDEKGNAILLGNSKGSVMRYRVEEERASNSVTFPRELSSDIFVLSVNKDTGTSKPVPKSSPDDQIFEDKKPSSSGKIGFIKIFGISAACAISVFLLMPMVIEGAARRKRRKQEENVVDFVAGNDFQDNVGFELHVRNSSTEGVHAVYGNRNMNESSRRRGPRRRPPSAIAEDISVDSASVLSYDASSIYSDDISFGPRSII